MNAAQKAFEMASPDKDTQSFVKAVQEMMAAERRLPVEDRRAGARARLLAEGVVLERADGSLALHPNYGGSAHER